MSYRLKPRIATPSGVFMLSLDGVRTNFTGKDVVSKVPATAKSPARDVTVKGITQEQIADLFARNHPFTKYFEEVADVKSAAITQMKDANGGKSNTAG
jgi:hypothetical protein